MEETEPIEENPDAQDIDDSNMADPVRLSAPDVYKDYAVRRLAIFEAGMIYLQELLPYAFTLTHLSYQMRSFDDAQSRLKCRKLLGIGGKEPSKVLQVLGSHESYFISIPRGYETWQVVVPVFLSVVSLVLLIFPSQCLRAVGDSKESTTFAGSLCCRLLASALIGIVGISWGAKPTTISSIKRTLVLHSTYCGAATFFLALACISLRTKVLIVLTSLHAVVTVVSLFYFVAVRQLNKPTPEKPNAKINNSDENHVN